MKRLIVLMLVVLILSLVGCKKEQSEEINPTIGVSEETAAEDACKLEHAISDESFEALQKYVADKF